MQFEWIDFYSEFATKLLSFKSDRKILIDRINAVYAAIDMKVPKLESGHEIIDIDPFTIFGLFNKGITNANRIAIIGSIAKEFRIEAKVPDNFDGIPVLNNLKATFYGFKDDRKKDDIDNIWNVFEAALLLADEDNESNRAEFSKWYDVVHDQFRVILLCMDDF
jgi:5-methylcytosine-specific restriction protein B